jgi:hypothetical protein
MLNNIPVKEVLLVLYGGLFGWTLGKLPIHWIYAVLAAAIILTVVEVL